jgi:hypothetical protein
MEVTLETSWKPLRLCKSNTILGDSGGIVTAAAQTHAACAIRAVLVTMQVYLGEVNQDAPGLFPAVR